MASFPITIPFLVLSPLSLRSGASKSRASSVTDGSLCDGCVGMVLAEEKEHKVALAVAVNSQASASRAAARRRSASNSKERVSSLMSRNSVNTILKHRTVNTNRSS